MKDPPQCQWLNGGSCTPYQRVYGEILTFAVYHEQSPEARNEKDDRTSVAWKKRGYGYSSSE